MNASRLAGGALAALMIVAVGPTPANAQPGGFQTEGVQSLPCSKWAVSPSSGSGPYLELIITNDTADSISAYWINDSGDLMDEVIVSANQTDVAFNTYRRTVFQLNDESGNCMRKFQVKNNATNPSITVN